MITQTLKDIISKMTEPELVEVLECVEKRAEKLPAPELFAPFFGRSDLASRLRTYLNALSDALPE
jgi:hypothetical protein